MGTQLRERLEENLAKIFGEGMAPYVIRRAFRQMEMDEDQLDHHNFREVLQHIERTSLERIYGANARQVTAELVSHVSKGTCIDRATVRRLRLDVGAQERARELL